MARLVILLAFLVPVLVQAQVRVVTNINHMLSLVPSQTQPWVDVLSFQTYGDWIGTRRYRYVKGDGLDTNLPNYAVSGGIMAYEGDLDVQMFGAKADGSDVTAQFQLALDAARRRPQNKLLRAPAGVYGIRTNVVVWEGVTLEGDGDATVLRLIPTAVIDQHIVRMGGLTNETFTPLTVDLLQRQTNVTVASVSGIAPGDAVLLWDKQWRVPPPDPQGTNCMLNQVLRINTNTLTITLQYPTANSFLVASNAFLAVVTNGGMAILKNLKMEIPEGSFGGGLHIRSSIESVVDGVMVTGPWDDPGINVERSTGIRISHARITDGQNVGSGGYGYGVGIADCSHDVEVHQITTERVRESAVYGGSSAVRWHHNTSVGDLYGMNAHASAVRDFEFSDNTLIDCVYTGLAVGFGTGADAGDFNGILRNNRILRCGHYGGLVSAPLTPPAFNTPFHILVDGLYVLSPGLNTNNVASYGFLINNGAKIILRNAVIDLEGTKEASRGVGVFNSTSVLIDNLTMVAATNIPGAYGISYHGCTNLTIKNGYFGYTGAVPIWHENTGDSFNVLVQNNITQSNLPPANFAITTVPGHIFINNTWGEGNFPVTEGLRIGSPGSLPFTVPFIIDKTTNTALQAQVRNRAEASGAFAGFNVTAGSANTVSGGLAAYSTGNSSHYADAIVLQTSSDATKMVFGALTPGQYIEAYVGGTAFNQLLISSNNVRLRDSTYGFAPFQSAILQLDSTNAGFLPPRLSTAQIPNVASPQEGLIVYNTTTSNLNVFTGSQGWKAFTLTAP